MFKKLLKYDFRSISGYWWIIAASTLGASLIGAIALRIAITNITDPRYELITTLTMLVGFISIVAVGASMAVTSILVYYRTYKNFFTDEGYLTFTLPVTRREHLLSKTINSLIWSAAHVLLLCVCAVIYLLIVPPSDTVISLVAFEKIASDLASFFDSTGFFAPVFILEAILASVISGIFGIVLINFCITVGAVVAKKHKLLASIGVYYLVNMILSLVVQVFFTIGFILSLEGFSYVMNSLESDIAMNAILAILFMIGILMMAAVTVAFYLFTVEKLERKLNLE